MDVEKENERARKAVSKLALGYDLVEVTEEYFVDEETALAHLAKKKIITKQMPPDIEAYKLLYGQTMYDDLSDEELEREKQRLLKQLLNLEKKKK